MRLIAISLVLIVIFACNKKNNNRATKIRNFMQEKKNELIYFPDSFRIKNLKEGNTYSPSKSKAFVYCSKPRIVTSINGNCHVCINQLKKWKSLINIFPAEEVRFLFFIYAENYAKFEIMNSREINFKYPVIYDYNKKFKLKNNIPDDYLLNTMLIDSTGKIIIIGNPIKSKEILNLYKKEIISD